MTHDLGPGFWIDVHFVRGNTRRLFFPDSSSDADFILYSIHWKLGPGVDLYTEDNRPIRLYRRGVAAIEIVEAVKDE